MEKKDVISYFDLHAASWDEEMIRSDAVIAAILDNALIGPGKDILDVACGTGVLIPDYLERKAASVTAVDISQEMAAIAKRKFPQETVTVLCGDIETLSLDRQFDCVMVYNAFPHFPDPANLIRVLAGYLKPGGALTVAHGMSREMIDAHHRGSASKISNGLIHEDALAALFAPNLRITAKISNDQMYQVTGIKE